MKGVLLLGLLICPSGVSAGFEDVNAPPPYRTDSTNPHLPWYRLKPGEFPPRGSEHRVVGELVEADFIHRSGQFRAGGGELVDFALLPFASVLRRDAEADLRDLPIGTVCEFSLYQDGHGLFTKAAAIHDEFSRLARQGQLYRVDSLEADALSLTPASRDGDRTKDAGPTRFLLDDSTRVWKGCREGKRSDLTIGDNVLVEIGGHPGKRPLRCTEIWVDETSRAMATEAQHKAHEAFLRARGLAARIDRIAGKTLTVTLFGDPHSVQALLDRDGIDPKRWANEHRFVDAVVASEELRTYNPPVDRKRAKVLEFQPMPDDSHGCSGVRWVIEPELLLEGFRRGRIIRLFVHPSWPVNDMPFGEGLYTEAPNVKPALKEPLHYPYRTDFANDDLPWYRLRPCEFPPLDSHHLLSGELLKVDGSHRSGRFRADRTGDLIDFTMPPFGVVRYLNAEADLTDIPLGTRCHFSLHQDDRGTFTRATIITDDFTNSAAQALSYRHDAMRPGDGILLLSLRHLPVKDERDQWIQPPDLGRAVFPVGPSTRLWKGDDRIGLTDLVPGDELLVNVCGPSATARGPCTDIWVGRATHKLATEKQRSKHFRSLRSGGLPAWIVDVQGTRLTIAFFSGNRDDFRTLLDKDVTGDGGFLTLADEELRPIQNLTTTFRLKSQSFEGSSGGTSGDSGVRWTMDTDRFDEPIRPGRVVLISRDGWTPRRNLDDVPPRSPDQPLERPPGT